jgi:uncharacterized membrane-anchored protein
MKSESSAPKKTLTPEMEFSEKLTFRDYLIATEQKANQPLPLWRFIAPLLVQVGLIMAVPTQAMYTGMTGKTVVLQSLPVSSNQVLRGSSLSLDYNISRTETLRRLPGWRDWVRRNTLRERTIAPGSNLYLILEEQESSNRFRRFNRYNSDMARAWIPVRISSDRPVYLPDNQVALKGTYEDGLINYGLESYYLPEEQRQQISQDIQQGQETQDGDRPPIMLRVKVDPQGNAVPVSMSIGDRNYRF